jgi:septum site-determining protein MinC
MTAVANVPQDAVLIFQVKGGLYPLTAIQLLGTDLAVFEKQLSAKIQQAPKFFYQAPVVVDLQKLSASSEKSLDFKALLDILSKQNLLPVGLKGGDAEQQAAALAIGLPSLRTSSQTDIEPTDNTEGTIAIDKIDNEKTAEKRLKGSPTKVITEPVRSGQQIYARGGDLIVLAPVSHGSELLADGHIHIYGPLRGRALAGVTGDESARIFCQSLEAELVSIAGEYKISEDIEQSLWRLAVEIFFEAGRLHIRVL